MSDANIITEAIQLAKTLPFSVLTRLAEVIRDCDPQQWSSTRAQMVSHISPPAYRTMATQFLDRWHSEAPEVLPESISLALLTAAQFAKDSGGNRIELAWTGPEVGLIPLRQTEQALLQLIESAQTRITIVSYAVYNIPRICEALIRAAHRSVQITFIIETPDRLEGQNTYSTLQALGPTVAACCQMFLWPREKRTLDAKGKLGILHVKCAVADGQMLFLSSANLTEYAFTLNMELGLLITGGNTPIQVENHFRQMIELGMFTQVFA